MKSRRVAVTGLGLMTPCGTGWNAYWRACLKAESHIRELPQFACERFSRQYGGTIPDFSPEEFVKQRKTLKLMSREIQLAVAASYLAIQDAAIRQDEMDRTRFGICLGTGIINNDLDEVGAGIRGGLDDQGRFRMDRFGQAGIKSLYPLWFLKYLPNMPACHVAITHGLHGPSNTITTSCAASTQAVGESFRIIQRGDADLMLAGGTDSKINAMGISRFHLLGLISRGFSPGTKGYCPFDRGHDGVILGEGAGLLVLEEMEHALRRGASIYGELLGYGSSSDYNYDPRDTEDFTGKRLAMVHALEDAGVPAGDIDFVLANGSGIPAEDIQEASAIRAVFENHLDRLRVCSLKPVTGHLVYGAGGVEMSAGLLALSEGLLPPVGNLKEPDEACDLPFVVKTAEKRTGRFFLFNSSGLCSQNASLVFGKVS